MKAGRPRITDRRVSFRILAAELEKLADIADRHDMRISAVLRAAVRSFVRQNIDDGHREA